MEINETFYAKTRKDWRSWLSKNYDKKKEIWLIRYKKHTNEISISYDESVEEALCFGWIDSTVKPVDENRTAQRYTPRRKNSPISEMNKERAKRLIKQKRMTPAGLEKIKDYLKEKFVMPKDIIEIIKKDKIVWKNFQKFPDYYKTIRISFIDGARYRPDEFEKRLKNFIKMTKKNKKFGMIR